LFQNTAVKINNNAVKVKGHNGYTLNVTAGFLPDFKCVSPGSDGFLR